MKRTKEELTNEKRNSKRTVDGMVMDELLKMGFSYGQIGTHYLHESIVLSTKMRVEDFRDINEFCQRIGSMVCKKYDSDIFRYSNNISFSIESAFTYGDINYLLDTFKRRYGHGDTKITKNIFIMTARQKIMESLEKEDKFNTTQLRLIIQGSVERITDYNLLKGICDIVLSVGGRSLLTEKGGVV